MSRNERIDQIGITILGIVSIYGLNLGYGWVSFVGLASTPFWFRTSYRNRQWGIFVTSFLVTGAWLVGCLHCLGLL